jgi:hypothetical protein
VPKIAPKPMPPAASVNKLSLEEFCHLSSRKNDQPLNVDRKDNQTFKSSLALPLSFIRWWERRTPWVRSISRRKNALPSFNLTGQLGTEFRAK